ncbi:MAG: DDE-type integrase/transposase/recombinase [Candidatus Omnitrophica bacterium]|nr:DDE-type integrase/transposase/recombinase [Candidatus Omnitrophota bacterium]
MDEKSLRELAIKRYENGELPKAIYTSLNKTKQWFFKWLKRFQNEADDWSTDQSRKPHNSPNKTDPKMEQVIIAQRQSLEETLYAQIGADSICWQLRKKGTKLPSPATINRIISRNHLTRKRPKYVSKNKDYPALAITKSNFLHQMDIVGPRHLKSDGRFYSININDAFDRRTLVNPKRRQTRVEVAQSLIRAWQTLGIPTYLQMDNTLANLGSHLHPHSFGLIVRLCLKLHVQPLFIPIREPWRNGIIERFNNLFDKTFFRAQSFKNFRYLCQKALSFEQFHMHNHRYSTMHGKTPMQQVSKNIKRLSKNFTIPKTLTITDGFVHFIRFIRSNRTLDINGEQFPMPMSVVYEYVWATIDTEQEKLFVYNNKKLIKELEYSLPKTSLDLSQLER